MTASGRPSRGRAAAFVVAALLVGAALGFGAGFLVSRDAWVAAQTGLFAASGALLFVGLTSAGRG